MRYGSNFPIRGYIGANADGYMLSAQRNGLRLPAYSRLDLRADRTFTYRKSRLTLFMEVVNAMNRDNYRPSSAGVNLNTRRVFEPMETTFPLLPVAGVLIEFERPGREAARSLAGLKATHECYLRVNCSCRASRYSRLSPIFVPFHSTT